MQWPTGLPKLHHQVEMRTIDHACTNIGMLHFYRCYIRYCNACTACCTMDNDEWLHKMAGLYTVWIKLISQSLLTSLYKTYIWQGWQCWHCCQNCTVARHSACPHHCKGFCSTHCWFSNKTSWLACRRQCCIQMPCHNALSLPNHSAVHISICRWEEQAGWPLVTKNLFLSATLLLMK